MRQRARAYEDLYRRLGTKEGEKDIYRMARVRERKKRDFNQAKCIKDEMEHLLLKEDEIRHLWQEYFDKLFNDENMDTTVQLDDSFDDTNRRFVRSVGAESDRHINIYSFIVRCDRRWPSTQ